MTGYVTARRVPILPIRVRGPAGPPADFLALLDTGFDGELSLPPAIAAAMGLVANFSRQCTLADGTDVWAPVCNAEVEWGPRWRHVEVLMIGPNPSVGMAMLADHKVFMEVIASGVIDIRPMP